MPDPAEPTATGVCIVAHSHPDITRGGGETAAWRQAETLRAAGHPALLVAAAERPPGRAFLERHAPDEVLYNINGGMTPDRLRWTDAGARAALVGFLAAQPVRCFHFHHFWRVGLDALHDLMDARPDARFVLTLHEMLAICANDGQMVRTRGRELCNAATDTRCALCFPDQLARHFTLRRAAMQAVLRRFDALVVPSAFLRDRFMAWGLDLPAMVVQENHLGEAAGAFARRTAPEPGLSERFAFFGQPTPTKGLDVLIRGFALARAQRPSITLSIYGCEREDVLRILPAVATALEEAGGAIVFHGRYDQADALGLMRGMGWVVMPSVWWENAPVVIEEAKRAGTPLIVSGIGGMAEKVRPGLDGLHFQRGSPSDLARVLLEAAHPDTRAAMQDTLSDALPREEFLAGLRPVLGLQ